MIGGSLIKFALIYGPFALTCGCNRREGSDIFLRRLVMVNTVKREPKKPYSKPTLTVYGTVPELTQSQGGNGQFHGGSILTSRPHDLREGGSRPGEEAKRTNIFTAYFLAVSV